MSERAMDRRDFLRTGLGVAAVAAIAAVPAVRALAADDYGGNKIPVALQLYTIGGETRKDVDAAVAQVAKLGYKAVEFAGYYGRDAKALKKLLDDNGLKCCGTHVPGGVMGLQGDNFQKNVEFAQVLGFKNLIVPSQNAKGKQGWEDSAKMFNGFADKLAPLGLRCGYHCHPGDFTKVDGETTWDIFCSNTKKEVITQCDLGHMGSAGVDPVAYLNKYPGRALSVHVKPSAKAGRNKIVGEDDMNWPAIFHACETVGATEWYVVEYDGGSMDKAAKTIETLRKWGKVA